MTRTKRNINSNILTFRNLKEVAIAKVEAARDAAMAGAGEARAVVTQLEKAFEQRLSRSVARLGVASAKEVRSLSRRVTELQASVEKLRRARARA